MQYEYFQNTNMRSILIMAGGTGGHVFPALAVADYIQAQGWQVLWLGTKTGMEATLVPAKGYAITWLNFAGVRGKGWLRLVLLPVQLLFAFGQCAKAIFKLRPDVVLGMGGYAAFPGGLMAVLLARPLVIHEQNSIAGLSNRVLACMADKVLVAFPRAFTSKADKPILCRELKKAWCGNPVRAEILGLAQPQERMAQRTGNLRLLVVGGSLGASILNEVVPQALALIPVDKRPMVVHQAGKNQFDKLSEHYRLAKVRAELKAFIEDMAAQYEWSDVVICRAGAMTVAELACVGAASILVPFPYAVDDHQTSNARFLSEERAAILLPQTELHPQKLAELLMSLTRQNLLQMAVEARRLGKPRATEEVAQQCMALAK